jgi:hypothetical protein
MLFLVPIVEGQTETKCLPALFTRIWYEAPFAREDQDTLIVLPSIETKGKHKLLSNDSFLGAKLGEASIYLDDRVKDPTIHRGRILIQFDADDECPVEQSRELLARIQKSHAHLIPQILCVVAVRKLEDWFVASAASLAGKLGFPPEMALPETFERVNGARWLTEQKQRLNPTTPYTKSTDAKPIVGALDLILCHAHSRSFHRLCKLLDALRTPPADTSASAS